MERDRSGFARRPHGRRGRGATPTASGRPSPRIARPRRERNQLELCDPRRPGGSHQIDLRGTDMLGNVAISANLWRGMIDTFNPRVVMTATATGASYRDAGGQVRYAVRYLCAAVDRNLDEATFTCPGRAMAKPCTQLRRQPGTQALFPDLTIRNGLAISYTAWSAAPAWRRRRARATRSAAARRPAPPAHRSWRQWPAGALPTPGDHRDPGRWRSVAAGTLTSRSQPRPLSRLRRWRFCSTARWCRRSTLPRVTPSHGFAAHGGHCDRRLGQHTLAAQATDGRAPRRRFFPVTFFTLDDAAWWSLSTPAR